MSTNTARGTSELLVGVGAEVGKLFTRRAEFGKLLKSRATR